MTRERLVWLLGLLALAAGVAWFASLTEWVEVDEPQPPRGEAARDHHYALRRLAETLGVPVQRPTGLNDLPPPGARLLLTSWHWDLFPERATALRRWVEAGGHLVIQSRALDTTSLGDWVPVDLDEPPEDEEPEEDEEKDEEETAEDAEEDAGRPAVTPVAPPAFTCRPLVEPAGVAPAFADMAPTADATWQLCSGTWHRLLVPQAPVQWSLVAQGRPQDGAVVLRVGVGRGSVTVVRTPELFQNTALLRGDHTLMATAILQLRPGVPLWVVAEEKRTPLVAWVWQEGSVAVLMGALALVAFLWRGAVRFGPPVAATARGRRSMAEQVSGTAQFLLHQGPQALHAAQVRALDATMRRHLATPQTPSPAQQPALPSSGLAPNLADPPERLAALARATGLAADELTRALEPRPARARRPGEWAHVLGLLELARRRLLGTPPNTSPPSHPPTPGPKDPA